MTRTRTYLRLLGMVVGLALGAGHASAEQSVEEVSARIFATCVDVLVTQSGVSHDALLAMAAGTPAEGVIELDPRPNRCRVILPVDAGRASAFFGHWAEVRPDWIDLDAGDCAILHSAGPPGRINYCDLPAMTLPDGSTIRFRLSEATFVGQTMQLSLSEAPEQ